MSDTARTYLSQAQDLIVHGELDRALDLLRKAKMLAGNDLELRINVLEELTKLRAGKTNDPEASAWRNQLEDCRAEAARIAAERARLIATTRDSSNSAYDDANASRESRRRRPWLLAACVAGGIGVTTATLLLVMASARSEPALARLESASDSAARERRSQWSQKVCNNLDGVVASALYAPREGDPLVLKDGYILVVARALETIPMNGADSDIDPDLFKWLLELAAYSGELINLQVAKEERSSMPDSASLVSLQGAKRVFRNFLAEAPKYGALGGVSSAGAREIDRSDQAEMGRKIGQALDNQIAVTKKVLERHLHGWQEIVTRLKRKYGWQLTTG